MMTEATMPITAHSIQAGKYDPSRSIVGEWLQPETASAIATRHKASGAQQRRPARSDLPLPIAVNLTRPKPDATDIPSRPTQI
jgi:hypothetical protein